MRIRIRRLWLGVCTPSEAMLLMRPTWWALQPPVWQRPCGRPITLPAPFFVPWHPSSGQVSPLSVAVTHCTTTACSKDKLSGMEGLERLHMPCLLQGARGHLHTQGGLGCPPEHLRDSGRASQLRLTGKFIQFSLSFSLYSGTQQYPFHRVTRILKCINIHKALRTVSAHRKKVINNEYYYCVKRL